MITDQELEKLMALIAAGKEHLFYLWHSWRLLRAAVLRDDRYECQKCKQRGRYRKAEIVHHVKHLKDRPDLALSKNDGEERQLISLCWICHQEEHPEKLLKRNAPKTDAFSNHERWD